MQELWQEVPASKNHRQLGWTLLLHDVDDDDYEERYQCYPDDDRHGNDPSHGQPKDDSRNEKEHQHEVENGKPTIPSSGVTHDLGQFDGDAHDGDGIKDEDPGDVEEEMAKRDL